jgi:hypothetical protein
MGHRNDDDRSEPRGPCRGDPESGRAPENDGAREADDATLSTLWRAIAAGEQIAGGRSVSGVLIMTMQRILLRSMLGAALAIFILAVFGELRFGTAAFLMTTVVLAGLARDIAANRRAT